MESLTKCEQEGDSELRKDKRCHLASASLIGSNSSRWAENETELGVRFAKYVVCVFLGNCRSETAKEGTEASHTARHTQGGSGALPERAKEGRTQGAHPMPLQIVSGCS